MVTIEKNKLHTDGSHTIELLIIKDIWLARQCRRLYDDNQADMLKRYLRIPCEALRAFEIYNSSMSLPRLVGKDRYRVTITKTENSQHSDAATENVVSWNWTR